MTRARLLTGPRAIAVAAAAVALEGYDLAIYGLFAVAIAGAFFPAHDPTSSLLLAVGTLGVGYVVRPIGGVVLGAYADRAGRKAAIALTVLLMSVSTGVIGLVPGAAAIGIAAPLLVVAARLVQGFAAGGATAGSIAYLVEAAPAHRRGFYASWQQASQVGAFLFSAAMGAVVAAVFAGSDWAWRIPFIFALLLGPLGLYIKRRLPEPDAFVAVRRIAPAQAIGATVIASRVAILSGFGLSVLWNVSGFILLFYMPTWVQREVGLSAGQAFAASAIGAALLFALCPLIGALSDRVGRKPPMIVGAAGLLLLVYPLLQAMADTRSFGVVIAAELGLAILIALYTAPVSSLLAEQFPTHSRSTGLSVAYNLSTLIVGAFGPLIVTWLIAVTGNPLAPAFYVAGGAAVSLVALASVREGLRRPLEG